MKASDPSTGWSFAPEPPPPPPPPVIPDPASTEYRRDYGLAAIQASAAFSAGGTGQGITVAVIDSGVMVNPPDLTGAISPQSTDIVAGRNQPNGTDQHATFIAGIIASRFNGQGTIGVAYQSTILSVRADEAGSCANTSGPVDQQGCQFNDADLGNGIDYAVAHGARIINLSVGAPEPSSRSFQDALSRAVAAGVVVTVAAGNDSAANPDYPAEYAIDPRYLGLVVAVGATDRTNTITSYSNKAGDAAAAYVVAPGDSRTTNCDGTSCWTISGTSFSAPTVAGAIALLLQAFPNLTGQQAINILETTADDLGAPGVDPVYGHGLIDLAKAFQPMGPMSVPQSATRVSEAMALAGSNVGAAFGDAFRRTQALTTIGFDSYGRRFAINLASGLPTARPTLISGGISPAMQQTGMAVAGKGFAMSFTAGLSQPDPSVLRGAARLVQQRQDRTDLNLDVRAGHFSFQAWRGQNGMAPAPELAAASNAFAALAHPTQAVRAAFDLKGVTVSSEMGASSRQPLFDYARIEPSSYAMVSLGLARPRWSASASFGRLDEPEGPLGSLIPGQTAFSMPARTEFASLHADFAALPWLTLSGEGSIGRTRAQSAFLNQSEPLVSSSWRLTARTQCAGDGCTHFELDLSQPVRVEAGQFWTVLPDVPLNYDDPLYFSRRSFSAAPGGRELDLRLGMDRSWDSFGLLQLQLVGARDAGNYAGQPLSLGLLANWRTRF